VLKLERCKHVKSQKLKKVAREANKAAPASKIEEEATNTDEVV